MLEIANDCEVCWLHEAPSCTFWSKARTKKGTPEQEAAWYEVAIDQLQTMKVKVLKKRARELGVDDEKLEDADDADVREDTEAWGESRLMMVGELCCVPVCMEVGPPDVAGPTLCCWEPC